MLSVGDVMRAEALQNSVFQRAAAAAALASGAAVTVHGDADGFVVEAGFKQVAQVALNPAGAQRKAQLLVEVAVRQPTLPVHTHRVAAHHT